MAGTQHLKRLALMGAMLIAAFLCLGFRLMDLQWFRHEELAERAARNTDRTVIREPRRGDIRDVRGNQLATSVFVKTVYADPSLITPYQRQVARAIAPVLEMPEAEVFQRLSRIHITNKLGVVTNNEYARLKTKVTVEKWAEVQAAMQKIDFGVDTNTLTRAQRQFFHQLRNKAVNTEAVDDQLRLYPSGTLAAHVLGYTISAENKEMGANVFDTSGVAGVELTLNSMLTGVRGWREIETDRRAREIVSNRVRDVQPRPGHHVCLTLDAGVQHIVESELAEAFKKHTPVSVSCIVVRPRTGEVLALANLPTYDPNRVSELSKRDYDRLRNRVITDMAEPGSTFKIVVVSGGLNERQISLRDTFDCEQGRFVFAGKVLHDHEHYGVLTVEDIIAKSSNIGSAKVGIRMGERKLYDYIRGFGFGQKTGIALPGEVRGWTWPVEKWNKLSISRIPMGHEMTATPLQMVMAMSAIANHGQLMLPMLVDRIEDEEGRTINKIAPIKVRNVITEEAARSMTTALKKVVSKDGTAAGAALDHYTVAGKTGTAQKPINGQYVKGKYFSSFIGFFPADEPELCISVVYDEPKNGYYGGQTAAPVFKRIAERAAAYLKIKPDREVPEKTQSKTGGVKDGLAARTN